MEKLYFFLNVIAWFVWGWSSFLIVITLYYSFTYNEVKKRVDSFKGVKRTFPLGFKCILWVVSFAWLLAEHYA